MTQDIVMEQNTN